MIPAREREGYCGEVIMLLRDASAGYHSPHLRHQRSKKGNKRLLLLK